MGNTNLWRFLCPAGGTQNCMNTGGKSPVFSPVGGANEAAHILSLMGGPGSGTGAQNHRNEHFSKPKEGGIQYGGIPH